uniref:Uncharacterized protein n=1 Tax=Lactuca sativa TaxID=4236 RepID=A0A9R1VMW7_LACSA|nr:hypothetical protein LSAT_V11C400160550 [Lactuca sativa]
MVAPTVTSIANVDVLVVTFYIKCPSFAKMKIGGFRLNQDINSFLSITLLLYRVSKFGFSFADYQSIIQLVHPQHTSIDVIGLVVAICDMGRDNYDKSKHKLNIQI